MPPTQSYELLPRTSTEVPPNIDEFKDKPVLRRRALYLLWRKARRLCRPLYVFAFLAVLLLLQVTFNASYVHGPPFIIDSHDTVYIAANIIDGALIDGAWGQSVRELIQLIGTDRVFVSIYGGPTEALKRFESSLPEGVGRSIVSETDDPIKLADIPHAILPTGEERIKRIAFLAEVRNKALQPLTKGGKRFDKVLFINDVYFSPEEATRLLWGTNVNMRGKAEYKAVCGTDFVTSWKYYDTYATRDMEGYSIGVPLFPWFANVGNDAVSRRDVLAGRDAVRVKSCWGGMVAFDARYFMKPAQTTAASAKLPLTFRSEPEPFWDASECCLVHADIMALPPFADAEKVEEVTRQQPMGWDGGVFMNPYVRTAYDAGTFRWIGFAKRFERLFAWPQDLINRAAKMPRFNYRRIEREGERIKDRVWVSNEKTGKEGRATLGGGHVKGMAEWAKKGHYEDFERVATRGGYCGVRQLLVLKKEGDDSGGNWDNLLDQVPPLEN